MKFGFRQAVISAGVFCVLLAALVSLDDRVRERFNELASEGSAAAWTDRAETFAGSVGTAVRYQSIENAPLLIFATAGAVLFLFMVRT